MHASIYSSRVCNGYPRQIGNFISRMHQGPSQSSSLSALFTQSAQSHQKCCAWVRTLTSQLPVKPSRGPFSQKHLYKQATLQMCQRTAPFPLPIIPFEKDQRRASASLPADTKAHPRLCASQRSFGTPRLGLPTRLVLSRHTYSVRPSRPLA